MHLTTCYWINKAVVSLLNIQQSVNFKFNLRQMSKKENLKTNRLQEPLRQCIICRIKSKDISHSEITLKILHKKYLQPYLRSCYIDKVQDLDVKYHPSRESYREVQYLVNEGEHLFYYNNFQSIVGKIQNLVLERVKKDNNLSVHFHGYPYKILSKYRLKQKKLLSKLRGSKKIEKVNSSGISTNGQQKSSPEKDKRNKMQRQIVRDSETASIRRLTRNLSLMVRKFDDHSANNNHFIFEMMEFQPQVAMDLTKIEMQEKFQRELQTNISIIQYQKEYLHTNSEFQSIKYVQNYGFKQATEHKFIENKNLNKQNQIIRKKKISTNKSQRKLQSKQNCCQRVQTDYDCQVIKREKKKSMSKKSIDKNTNLFNSIRKCKKENVPKAINVGKSRSIKYL